MQMPNLEPIFGKGQKLKVTLVAIAFSFLGAGGTNLSSIGDVIQQQLGPGVEAPVHGLIVDQRLEPTFILKSDEGVLSNVLVPIEDFEAFTIGDYYVERPGYVPPAIQPDRYKMSKPEFEPQDLRW